MKVNQSMLQNMKLVANQKNDKINYRNFPEYASECVVEEIITMLEKMECDNFDLLMIYKLLTNRIFNLQNKKEKTMSLSLYH